jgi:hypothetical protein
MDFMNNPKRTYTNWTLNPNYPIFWLKPIYTSIPPRPKVAVAQLIQMMWITVKLEGFLL